MSKTGKIYVGKSKLYKHVYLYKNSSGDITYHGAISKSKKCISQIAKGGFESERECAIWVDKQLLYLNEEPVNILIKK